MNDTPATLNLVLYQPEIPPNTGNIIRLAANTGARMHLIEPIAFELDDKRLRRAGLDYGEWKDMQVHASWEAFLETCQPQNLYAISTRGSRWFSDASFKPGDYVVFGPETRGLPAELLAQQPAENVLRIPMQEGSRSMNLSNAAAVIVYEAWRQMGFPNAL
ncbi:tRNA (uridine(34)/cytosine(34)/5-carboxymethylaminomethyluridine(34)-2'-O)-methyltransferase TrmL [Pseudomaricurvus alkylphenolicus]|jgi:tRNA (cytidine/uridine-2'-O-)-methyltransferase|uniref:tRNA (uridine(34)/cytosine(34)/5- carboxymethylaminomethyluridine(34)-2'-O)- methyltransferase TrmL n=1 Tax=Pseudomaricurvus alkylphenolicus TaxID=1306991 RepID=UPI00141F8B55|nr:tRNA (uridine(34)/cytosine(34)/5-carboxymethylaminomethyluridine(34)-2'-O)-methyltransferase TrmL [Pseudomaricurvus alkylphenolicus]NIB44381.1 tRNA (uridine(34)/cytosine(34)/5-carboxymethylaminomethyluridine(34)-2'-O)-methyltransferase TrmL [Pseudomaricurvus alkylphenolicus]